ncbi:MAG: adenosylmethionine--8-amino-7-oxononanoate transaminase [Burkholderiales bacterium]|nr:adenosylmethionine--8-amino-7-oxononanoate transaminase [Burkholderiales bacterium]
MKEDYVQRSRASVWHPCTQMKHHERVPLIPIARGEGVWLYDFEGRRYLDGISSWWVNLFGHNNLRINRAISDQLGKFAHTMLAGCTHEPVIELSERLSALTGGKLGHCFYGSDGASAIEIALKMSFQYWRNCGHSGKDRYISLQNGYHGETIGALSVTDVRLFKDTYAPLLRPSEQMPTPDTRRAEPGESPRDFAFRCARSLAAWLEEHGDETAAFILEPLVQCAAGMAMYDAEYLRQARALCAQHQVHLIADEIAVGFGRTGTFFACEQAPVTPDFLCLSKGLTGGYLPLSVVLARPEIYQAFYDDDIAHGFLHSHSYTGNPLACRAALATLEIFGEDKVIESNQGKAKAMREATRAIAQHAKVKNFRQCGMICAFEVETDDPHFGEHFREQATAAELLLRPIGNTVYFMPPYVIDAAEIEVLASRTLKIIDST